MTTSNTNLLESKTKFSISNHKANKTYCEKDFFGWSN